MVVRYERMLDGDTEPTDKHMLKHVGRRAGLWSSLHEYLATHYDHTPELDFGGKKYGWAIRYRKSRKTLVTLFPEIGGFTALVVLGREEVAKANAILGELSTNVREILTTTEQLRDGRWLWIRPTNKADIESVKELLSTKRRPKQSTS